MRASPASRLARSCAWRPVRARVVELPDVVVERRQLASSTHGVRVPRHRGPALVVDAAVAEHLEVLRLVALGRRRRRRTSTSMLTPSIGVCCTPLHGRRLGQPGRFEDRSARRRSRGGTGGAPRPCALMPFGQWTMVPLRVPPQCEATCLVHWYGVSIACAQPTA